MLLFAVDAKATHLMGGEITWRCLGNGNFIFQMKVYRDCTTGVPVGPTSLRVHNHPTVTSIALSQVSFSDISPQCNGAGPTYNCANQVAGNTAVEEYIFESNPVNLPGVPPPQGWVFTFSSCCRNAAIINLSLSGPAGAPTNGFTLRAVMYSYNAQNTSPCYDSSPFFQERPSIIICAGSPFVYNPHAYDSDLDSVSYSFANPLNELVGAFSPANPTPIPFEPGFSLTSPFPGPNLNPNNVPVSLNAQTGEMSFTSFTQGNYVVVVKVSSYRCGLLIAEIFREIQLVILSCGPNFAPAVSAPQLSSGGAFTSFSDTVTAGDLVTFTITGNDPGFLPLGNPQSVIVEAAGGQFGTNFTDPNSGCPFLPCATLSPAPPASGPNTISTTFSWQTSCEHIPEENGCSYQSKLHTFTFLFKDDYCPAPSYNVVTVNLFVLTLPEVASPDLRCINVLPNGNTELTWIPPIDTAGTFNSYHLFYSTNLNGPYVKIDSLYTINQTTYTHVGAGANAAPGYYFIRTRSGCQQRTFAPALDTLASIFASIGPLSGTGYPVNWTPLSVPLPPTASAQYDVLKGQPVLNLVNQTAQLTHPDSVANCLEQVRYRIELPDQSGCVSGSNLVQQSINFNQLPIAPDFDSISVFSGGPSVALGWQDLSGSNPFYTYIVYQVVNGFEVPVDTVASGGEFLLTLDSAAFDGPVSYTLAVLDSCGNLGPFGPVHTSIYLEGLIDPCNNVAELTWTPYIGWSAPPAYYAVYYSKNGGPWSLADTFSVSGNRYDLAGLEPGSNYCLYITAISADGSASTSSNYFCLNSSSISAPDFSYLNYVTVEDDRTIQLKVYYDNTANIGKYLFTRINMVTGNLDTLGPFPIDISTPYINFSDEFVATDRHYYRYTLYFLDSCNGLVAESNIGQSILLQGKTLDGYYNRLNWTAYETWPTGVEKYAVLRCISEDCAVYRRIADTGDSVLFFTEDVWDSIPVDGKIRYRIMAVEEDGNPYFFKENSFSNVIELEHEPLVFIPNAWVRSGGFTSDFRPRGSFPKLAIKYLFTIYDRWGHVIFETTETDVGWNGTAGGTPVPNGAYVYDVRIYTPDNDEIRRVGTVTILD